VPQPRARVGKGFVAGLVVFCVAGFGAPAFFVSNGLTVAGDKQKESAADISKISASAVQQRQARDGKQQQQ